MPIEEARRRRICGAVVEGHLPAGVDEDAFIARVGAASTISSPPPTMTDTVAVFSHGGVINVASARHPAALARLLCVQVDYAGVTRLLSSRTGEATVAAINGTEHVWDLLPANTSAMCSYTMPASTLHLAGRALDLDALDRHLRAVGIPRAGELRARADLWRPVQPDVPGVRRRVEVGAAPAAAARADAVGARHGPRVQGGGRAGGHPGTRRARGDDAQRRLGARRAVPDGRVRAGPGRPATPTSSRRSATRPPSTACVDALIKVLADLHAVDPEAVGLGDFGKPTATSSGRSGAGVRSGTWCKTEDDPRDADVQRLHAKLGDAIPPQSRSAIVHGDYRIDNTMLDADGRHQGAGGAGLGDVDAG